MRATTFWRAVAVAVSSAMVAAVVPASPSGAGSPWPPPRSGELSTLTYNVAGLPEVLSGSNPSVNTAIISPLLNAYDLVLVQEDWANPDPPVPGVSVYHEILISEVDHPYLSDPAPVPLGTNPVRPSALLSDGLNQMSQFPFAGPERHMWPSCFGGIDTSDGGAADCLAEKGFSFSRTTVAPGVEIDVYNLHAEAGRTPADNLAHAEDFEVLADFINTNSAGRAVIVGGDYNLHTDREFDAGVFDTFRAEAGMTDVCEVVDCGADEHKIDKFTFRNGDDVVLEPLSHTFEREIFQDPAGEPLSDHDPLHVDWSWELVPTFSDVPNSSSIVDEVEFLVDEDVIAGFPDGTFRPGATLTRASAAAILYRAEEGAEPGPCPTAPFPDVPASHPFCTAIDWMVDNDYTTGFHDGLFRPGIRVTRQAIAAFLFRIMIPNHETFVCSVPPYPDIPVSHPFCMAIVHLNDGVLPGQFPGPLFRPLQALQRGEMARLTFAFVTGLATPR
jgi:hypothetical protein